MRAIPAGTKTELVGQYVGQKCGVEFQPGMYQALAVLNDKDDFIAGVVISEYRGHDCQVSCATESSVAWTDMVVRAVFDYIFNQLGCVRCTSFTKKGNKRAREFMERLGFQLEGNLRLGFDGTRDALIYGYLKSECRYLEPLKEAPDGQEDTESASPARSSSNGSGAGRNEQGYSDSERVSQSY